MLALDWNNSKGWNLELFEGTFFDPSIHYPDGCGGQGQARLKSGVRNFILVSHMGARFQTLRPCFVAFPAALVGSWIGSRVTETGTSIYKGC